MTGTQAVGKGKSEFPRLRKDIDLMPMRGEDGKTLIVVRDPLELDSRGPAALSTGALPLLSLLDGAHSPEQIRLHLVEQTARAGQLTAIPLEVVESLILGLDEAYLLDNGRYRDARTRLVENFIALTDRPPALAGKSYPAEKSELQQFIAGLLGSAGENPKLAELKDKPVLALVTPHIELSVGEKIYSAGYGLLNGRSYDRVVVLGVGHSMERGLFSLTAKDYRTPLGRVPTEQLAVSRLKKAAGPLALEDDFAHRSEHSIEFQVLFLQSVLEGPFTLVPVLCGSLYGDLILGDKKRPREIKELLPALDYLSELLADSSKKTLLLAGVDFSHVGPKFGDRKPAIQITSGSSSHDLTLLRHLAGRDVEAFCAEGKGVLDRYHVCGFSVLSLLLEVLPPEAKGVELGHRVWHEAPTQSAVSFAAAAFYMD
ncbi:MAG: AmmeMemoRadiSam system protein B [Candidatus Glassbacteria bacterium RIFCSPLOWO2_12_FULL_58_11]|uniref:AmmeMemoRadiSam system protein B n=1 Tax=Candidatus Glassbacteria bacterium RIFCSPLOWO2_12_FULL_58_11 TaxID=1817867 RepID=A0A1F5YYS3_9BACT|nr:MAG: AmmeMemoRadiSam system protein B [Candidatus Glassbacteria bacterium RIFCSPLOWO2_12_FULL_58_11]